MLGLVCSVFQFWPEEESLTLHMGWEHDPLKSIILMCFFPPSNRENHVFWEWKLFLELISPKKTSLEPGMLILFCSLFWLANLKHCFGSAAGLSGGLHQTEIAGSPCKFWSSWWCWSAGPGTTICTRALTLYHNSGQRASPSYGLTSWGNWFWCFWFFAVEKYSLGIMLCLS